MQETTYRGYRIRYHCAEQWFAHIYRPGSSRAMTDIPTATRQEGEENLLAKARGIIDREEEKAKAGDERGNG